jgi:hypothetical protein
MAILVWGLLQKSQIDDETIEEAIARLITEHNADETAHLEVGQSLQSHKASVIIDHIVDSVVTDKIGDFQITPPKISTDKMHIWPSFESFDLWTSAGSGSKQTYLGALFIQTGAVLNNYYFMYTASDAVGVDFQNKNPVFECFVKFFLGTNLLSYFGVGMFDTEFIGFKIDGSTLYAMVASNENIYTSAISGIDITAKHCYRVVVDSDVSYKFYVDDVLKATITDGIPNWGSDVLTLFCLYIKTTNTTSKSMIVYNLSYMQDN